MNNNSNNVELQGQVVSEPVFDYEAYNERFYSFKLKVIRYSGTPDIIPITASEKILWMEEDQPCCPAVGDFVQITGQFRSYNKVVDGANRLILFVFANKVVESQVHEFTNKVSLTGFICKTPIYRETPMGREICDVLMAVNRAYNKSDYIPVIAWGRNAQFAEKLSLGEQIQIEGRIQSREYKKDHGNGQVETKVAYEVSVNMISRVG